MNTEIMFVAIISVVMFATVARQWLKTREVQAASGLSDEVMKKLDKVEKLEERIRVLEKIVTNKQAQLAEEIENL